ncbi:MAG: tungstate transport system permease protein [Clostridia bacterium]|nr:tungstate transport system permease protein [Clostridia bacterium]
MTDYGLLSSIWQFFTSLGDEFTGIVGLSLAVSGSAVVIGALIGVPLGALLGLKRFPGRRLLLRLIYTLMSLPPVLAGLVVYMVFCRNGPLGFLNILFTPAAMIVAQVLLATPIIAGISAAAVAAKEKLAMDTARSLGASRRQAAWMVIKEARSGIIAGIMTGFGRAFGEVGAVMLVGGNIRYYTRVLTTSIVLETRQGNFEFAVALGGVLLALSFVVSSILLHLDESKLG